MNVYLDTIGCRLNQSEIELYARQFRLAGHMLVPSAQEADLVVVNTCAVTQKAVADSRQKIRQVGRNGNAQVAVTGCWSTLEPERARSLPGVVEVISNDQKDQLVSILVGQPAEQLDPTMIERQPIPGLRLRTRAFIKVQDGCDNRCTFCVTTVARGESRSRSIKSVVADIESALAGGAKEVVLTGVHLGAWGKDLDKQMALQDLVRVVLSCAGSARVRLSSLEPWDLEAGFFELWDDRRLCKHLHLPLQSGCAATLRRMARKTNPSSFARLVSAARKAIPGVAISTDVIVGFPGETDDEFDRSLRFVEEMQFASGHIFTYSPRPGTAAANMPHQVQSSIQKRRNALMREVIEQSKLDYQKHFLGKDLDVLWEKATTHAGQGWQLNGLTGNYLRVVANAPTSHWNEITPVRIETTGKQALRATILSKP